MINLRSFILVIAALGAVEFPSSIAFAKQEPGPPGSPPPLSEAERNVGIPGVEFSDVIVARGSPSLPDGTVHPDETLLSIPYAYRYTAVVTEDVKGYSFTVGGVQAPAGSPGYYAGSFFSSRDYERARQTPPMDMWCFLPQVAGGKRENICLLRNHPKRAAIAPTRLNPYLWSSFAPMTGSFDYVNTPIFKRQEVELPFQPVLEYRFINWKNDVAWVELYSMGSFVTRRSIAKNSNGEYRLRTVGGDFLLEKDSADSNAVRITVATGEPPKTSFLIRVKLEIDAKSRATNCEVLESDAPEKLQERVCEMFRQRRKFPVSSTTIEKTVRLRLPAD